MPGPEQAMEAAWWDAPYTGPEHQRTFDAAWHAALAYRDAEVAELLERLLHTAGTGNAEDECSREDAEALLATLRSRTGDDG